MASPRPRPFLAPLFLLFTLAGTAGAQVDLPRSGGNRPPPANDPPSPELPDRDKGPRRGIIPHLVCTICTELNYTAPRKRPTEGGNFWAYCAPCHTDRIHRPSVRGGGGETLDLPSGGGSRPAGSAPGANPTQGEPGPSSAPRSRSQLAAANAVYDAIRPIEKSKDPLLGKALESLLALGEDGLVASRVALQGESEAELLVATRLLLRVGRAEDALRIVERLRGELPRGLGPKLLKELMAQDPVHGSPELLVKLLEHPQLRMRQVAVKGLRKQLTPQLLPSLNRMLGSKKSETRLLSVELIAAIDDPAVVDILFEHIDDASARVASRVVEALAGISDKRVDLELEALAFHSRWILRKNAYALLALVDREDLTLEPILDGRNVEALLQGLESTDSFVYGTCATALAGIGFRARQPEGTAWLDREVTGRLIAVTSGREFHADYSALLPRALRRLRLITGVDFGSNGPAWARWWIENREGFYARRIGLSLEGSRLGRLEILYRSTGVDSGVFGLFAPGVGELALKERSAAGEVFRITEAQARDLASLCEREGILGPERLPGQRGTAGRGVRTIEVLVDGRGKRFAFGSDVSEPWFERLAGAARDLRERNRWQRYPDLGRYESERDFWEGESEWWSAEHDELERALRLKSLVMAVLPTVPPSQRQAAVAELERLFETEGVADATDFRTFLELVRDEGFYAGRARRLIGLALMAAQAESEREEHRISTERANDLIDLLNARFGGDAAEDMAVIALASGSDYVRSLAEDSRPLVRAVAATALGAGIRRMSPDSAEADRDAQLLIALLEDPEPFVEAAVCLSLGHAGVETARTDLLVRARVADPAVRASALRAIGELGGEFVLEALVLGASAPEAEVRVSAAEGLVALNDPKAAPLLVSMLARGRESDVFEPARRGLLELAEEGYPELERVMNSPVHRARREATLILSYQGFPRSAGVLIGLLEDDRTDESVADELAILTGLDLREAEDPVFQWERWWEQVVHDDSLVWLRAAMERRGVEAPPASALAGLGRLEGALFLLEVSLRPEDFLAERGRRELSRILGRELDPPRNDDERTVWFESLRQEIVASYEA